MADLLAAVTIGVFVVMAVVALAIMLFGPGSHDQIGRGGLSLDAPDRPAAPPPGSAAARAEADEEIRQLVEAKAARRAARGLPALDVEAEIEAITSAPPPRGGDPALREEIRGLVEARNERRARQGKPPLEVEAEIDRQMDELGA